MAKQPPAKGNWKISRHEKKFKNSLILKIFPYDWSTVESKKILDWTVNSADCLCGFKIWIMVIFPYSNKLSWKQKRVFVLTDLFFCWILAHSLSLFYSHAVLNKNTGTMGVKYEQLWRIILNCDWLAQNQIFNLDRSKN